jgi:hypothetical protein
LNLLDHVAKRIVVEDFGLVGVIAERSKTSTAAIYQGGYRYPAGVAQSSPLSLEA